MKCKKCGEELPKNSKFCTKCGAKVEDESVEEKLDEQIKDEIIENSIETKEIIDNSESNEVKIEEPQFEEDKKQ